MTDILDPLNSPIAKLNEAADELGQELDACCAGTENGDLDLLLRVYFMLDWMADYGKELSRMANVHLPVFGRKIHAKMQDAGLEKMQSHGHSITPEMEVYVSVLKENRQRALEWLKTHPTGCELVKEDYNAKSLQSFVKDMIAEGRVPPEFVKATLMPVLKTRKVASK